MKPITSAQIEALSREVKDAAGQSTETALGQLRDDGKLSREALQIAIGKGDQLKGRLIPFLKAMIMEMAANIQGCVKRIFEGEQIDIVPTDGTENLANADDIFAYVDPDFKKYGCDVRGKPTKKTPVEVHEMMENGDFARIFGGFNVSLGQICLSQHQIKAFVKDHRDKLRADGYATLFLFKVVFNEGAPRQREEFFVADVNVRDVGSLRVFVYRFSDGRVWDAGGRHRVVVPQLSLEH